MSTPLVESNFSFSSLFWFLVLFLDPRRWLGALFALVGVAASIVATALPTVVQPLSQPPITHLPKRPLRTPSSRHTTVQPSSIPKPPRRPHTADTITLSPHPTSSFGSPTPPFTTHCILMASPTSALPPDPTPLDTTPPPTQPDLKLVPVVPVFHPVPPSQPPPSQPTTPASASPPISLYNHAVALKSLDCLDLATSEFPSHRRTSSQSSKRPFRLPLPKLGFRKRKSATDLKESASNESDRSKESNPEEGLNESSTRPVKGSGPVSDPTVPAQDLPRSSTPARRKFSLFSRESSVSRGKSRDKEIKSSSLPIPASPDPMPSVPPLGTVIRRDYALPASPAACTSNESPKSQLFPLVQTQTPPERPARTDPYKTYGVPVPGSDRARAFLKAEKEMRAERERRVHKAGSAESLRTERDEKGKKPAANVVAGVAVGAAKEADAAITISETRDGAVSPARTEQSSTHRRRRSWGLARRGSEASRTQEPEVPRMTRIQIPTGKRWKEKKNDKPGNYSRVRDSLDGSKGASAKERGYVSDMAVPSLTYKLM